MKKTSKLGTKLLIGVVFLVAVLCTCICIVSFLRYQKSISKVYNDQGYIVGDIILDHVDKDRIAQYAATFEKDSYYDILSDYMQSVMDASNAAYIYMMIPNEDGTMTYIWDCTGMDLGDSEPMSSYVDIMRNVYLTGERTDNYIVRNSKKYGYLTSSVLPVKDSSGNICCLLLVDIHMEIIVETIWNYVVTIIGVSMILLALFAIIFKGFMKYGVLMPIEKMREEAHNFAANHDNEVQITGILDSIKTGDELQDLAFSISAMENDIVNYIANIRSVTAEKERIGAELNVATKIQADMLPSIFPPFPDCKEFDIFASMDPAKEVGGDFYDFFMIDDTHLGMVMADVSGKGVPAALFMVISKTLIKNSAGVIASPKEVLEKVNNQLCENNTAEMFVTVWFGILDITTGVVRAANAGHEYPAIRGADSEYSLFKDPHGFVLAGMENLKYKEYEFTIEPGGALFLYTDGVAEATSADKELYGTDRMLAALNKARNLPIEESLPFVRKDIDSFVGEAEQFDDITMMCIRYKGPA